MILRRFTLARPFAAALLAVLSSTAVADDKRTEPDDAPELDARTPYVPHTVIVAERDDFDIVTFKDVGVSETVAGPRDLFFEALSHAIALELSADGLTAAESAWSEWAADPRSHLFCDRTHLYIDVWTGFDPARIGFSLWTGCGEDDRLAWHEVELGEATGPNLAGRIAQEIVRYLP